MNWLKGKRKKKAINEIIKQSATAKSLEYRLEKLDYCHLEYINIILTAIKKRNGSMLWAFDALLLEMINNANITASMAKADPSNFIIILDQQIELLARNIATEVIKTQKPKVPDGCHLANNRIISEIIRQIKLGNKRYEILSILNGKIAEEPIIFIDGIIEWAKTHVEILFIILQPILKKSEPEGCSINIDWCKQELNTLLIAERDPRKTIAKFVENVSKSFGIVYNGYDKALKNRESEAMELWKQVKYQGTTSDTTEYNILAGEFVINESMIIDNIAAKLINGEEPTQIKIEIHAFIAKLIENRDNIKKELFKSSFADQPVRSSSAGGPPEIR